MSNGCTGDYRNAARLCAGLLTATLVLPAVGAAAEVATGPGPMPMPIADRAAPADAPAPPARDASALASVVDALVREALAANLELEASDAVVAQRLAALDQARARYLPALDLVARYSRADGGRTIDLPVGDLLNPVYATLNQLSGETRFPTIRNEEIRLLRAREQDTRLTLVQPLYDARLGAARDAALARHEASAAAREALRGRVARDVRQAYFRWLQADAQLGILDATLELARENLRVNESLFRNGRITRDLVFRAEADVLEVEQARLGAVNGRSLAQSWVNLLRAAPFDRPLPAPEARDDDVEHVRAGLARRAGQPGLGRAARPAAELPALTALALDGRPELRELDAAAAAAVAGERLARAAFRPQLAFAVDAGSQGEQYRFGDEERFVLASVVLRFNLLAGGADRAALRGARAAQAEAQAGRALTEQRIRLEVQSALQDLAVAEASLDTAAKRVEAASGAFAIARRKRDLGQIAQAEYVDGRRALTDAQLNLNLTRFAALAALAELEYALGAGLRPATEMTP